MGELSASVASMLVADFEADYFGTEDQPARFVSLTLRSDVLDAASWLAGVHGLRVFDAIQTGYGMRRCCGGTGVPDVRGVR